MCIYHLCEPCYDFFLRLTLSSVLNRACMCSHVFACGTCAEFCAVAYVLPHVWRLLSIQDDAFDVIVKLKSCFGESKREKEASIIKVEVKICVTSNSSVWINPERTHERERDCVCEMWSQCQNPKLVWLRFRPFFLLSLVSHGRRISGCLALL